MKLLWEGGECSSRDVWDAVNERLEGKRTISRASVINFLNAMCEDGVLAFHEVTGKGGHRRIYRAAKTELEYWTWMINIVDSTLKKAAGLYHV